MQRNIDYLIDNNFDALVLGGGIQGIAILHRLAQCGIKSALIEKDDFASGSSANNLKVIHGGLRYLQTGDFSRMRRSIKARRAFMQLVPSLVRSQGFVIPNEKFGLKSRFFMKIALLVNDIVSYDRNLFIDPSCQLPPGKILNANDFAKPFLKEKKYFSCSGAMWFDALVHDSGRLAIELIKTAERNGAVSYNYVKAEKLQNNANSVCGVVATDLESGKSFNIKAGIVIDATGSGSDLIHSNNKTHDNRVKSKWWKATNLIFNRRIDTPYAVGLPSTQEGYGNDSESRYFFFVPYKDTTLFGTFYSLIEDSPDDLSVKKEDVENMLSVAQKLCPDAGLKIRDVSMCHVGVVPASASSSNGNSSIAKNSVVRVMPSSSSLDGLITVQSVKYTESFQVAQEVINLVSRNLGLKCKNSKSEFAIKIEDRSCLSIKEIIQKAVEEEMAIHLTDLIIRRTTIGETEYPGDDLAENYASVMGDIAGWSSDRRQNEIIQLKEYYRARAAHQLV